MSRQGDIAAAHMEELAKLFQKVNRLELAALDDGEVSSLLGSARFAFSHVVVLGRALREENETRGRWRKETGRRKGAGDGE